jgi:hypothetical protein
VARKKKASTSAAEAVSLAEVPVMLATERLPLAEPGSVEIHQRAAVLEVADAAQLVELAADPALRAFLLCRLSPTVALVDPGRGEELAEVLLRRGHTPRVEKAAGSS